MKSIQATQDHAFLETIQRSQGVNPHGIVKLHMAQSRKSIKKGDKSPITSVGREGVNLTMPRPQQEHTSKREKQLLIVTYNNTTPTKNLCDRWLNSVYIQCNGNQPANTDQKRNKSKSIMDIEAIGDNDAFRTY